MSVCTRSNFYKNHSDFSISIVLKFSPKVNSIVISIVPGFTVLPFINTVSNRSRDLMLIHLGARAMPDSDSEMIKAVIPQLPHPQ